MKPSTETVDGILVVRDDLFPGGTKARYLASIFDGADEAVYASPAEGGAQTALAQCARNVGARATIFVAKRAEPHPRTVMAKALGAKIVEVAPGYLTVVQARARAYAEAEGAALLPFGGDMPGAVKAIAGAARALNLKPAEVWCAAGSGVLARGLMMAWPNARRHVVQVGRALTEAEVGHAEIHIYPRPFAKTALMGAPFPSDPHYDAKAWEICRARRGAGLVLFWNVTGPAT